MAELDSKRVPQANRLDVVRAMVDVIGAGVTWLDFKPYHVLGSQGLAWSRRAGWSRRKPREFLQGLEQLLRIGRRQHPGHLAVLHRDLEREVLELAVH